jgi:hypothetical protein
MSARLVLCLCLALAPVQESAPFVRVRAGAGRLLQGREVRVLEPGAGALRLAGPYGRVESGAATRVELSWRGLASATLSGPLAFELSREPGLTLESFQLVELEVRRGTFALELAGLGSLEFAAGALRVRSLPDGSCELLNRGGKALEFWRAEERRLAIGPGQCLRVGPARD